VSGPQLTKPLRRAVPFKRPVRSSTASHGAQDFAQISKRLPPRGFVLATGRQPEKADAHPYDPLSTTAWRRGGNEGAGETDRATTGERGEGRGGVARMTRYPGI
jgi:hypothetical protein